MFLHVDWVRIDSVGIQMALSCLEPFLFFFGGGFHSVFFLSLTHRRINEWSGSGTTSHCTTCHNTRKGQSGFMRANSPSKTLRFASRRSHMGEKCKAVERTKMPTDNVKQQKSLT